MADPDPKALIADCQVPDNFDYDTFMRAVHWHRCRTMRVALCPRTLPRPVMSTPKVESSQTELKDLDASWLLIGIGESPEFSPTIQQLNGALGGALSRLRDRGDLKGGLCELTVLPVAPGIKAARLIIVGLGRTDEITPARWEQALLTGTRRAAGTKAATLAIALPEEVVSKLGLKKASLLSAYAAVVGGCGPGLYKSESDRFSFERVIVASPSGDADVQALERGGILAEAVNLTRELVNRHPEDINPEAFAQRAVREASNQGIATEVFDQNRLQQERMQALLAVSRGSGHDPRVVILRYQGGKADSPWLAFCGKGVTFDSGGLSLKPSDSMITMKGDMAGAATVLAAFVAISRLKIPVNLIGAVGLVENMIGPNSYKLGEVLTARNGVTIEVHNTDAEGRLVLADVLSYVAEELPAGIVDLATLTGSCMVALGPDIAGAFSNNQSLCDQVVSAAKAAGEEVWQMPMSESFAEQLKCDFADVKNVGSKWGGAITAAKFLERFVSNIPWVHLDIAGPSFADSGKPFRDVGATGSSVRTLVELAERWSQK
jgi:leucyl aminopeptidase